jgi:hypothetical protein
MTWDPAIDFIGNPNELKVSASDVGAEATCGRQLALKSRPTVYLRDWRRSWPPRGQGVPFVLGHLADALAESDAADVEAVGGLAAWADAWMEQAGVHRLTRRYLSRALENMRDIHDGVEAELGESLQTLANPAEISGGSRTLFVWAALFGTASGVREIRRIRFGAARDGTRDGDRRWSAVAGYVAARFSGLPSATRVRVLEVGASDASTCLIFDGTPEEATRFYDAEAKPHIESLLQADHVVAGNQCQSCKGAGRCEALVSVYGMFGLSGPGLGTRSISATALQRYERCPGQWLYSNSSIPRSDSTSSDAQSRGIAVHEWLKAAHGRGIGCTLEDLPSPGTGLGLAAELLTPELYAEIYPYLLNHVNDCPVDRAGDAFVLAEQNLHGFDHSAELIAIAKPDLAYRDGDYLVLREFKTSAAPYPSGRADAYERTLQVPFLLRMLESGLAARYGAAHGRVEVELLTPAQQDVWAWDTDDLPVMAMAGGDLNRAADQWHTDSVWTTKPGPQCNWCEWRGWCPDADSAAPTASPSQSQDELLVEDDDEPPF